MGSRIARADDRSDTDAVNVAAKLGEMHLLLTDQHYDVRPLIVMPPALPEQVAALESTLGVALPSAFRDAMLTVSSHVQFGWFAGDRKFARPFHQNVSGDLHWSLDLTVQFETARRSWCAAAFSNAADPFDAVWHNKLAFYEVGNGDFLAFDLSNETHGQIVYLSHDDGEGHGYVLAQDFRDLLSRWLPLACTGGEDWQWLPFTTGPASGLDPDGEQAAAWRRALAIASVWES